MNKKLLGAFAAAATVGAAYYHEDIQESLTGGSLSPVEVCVQGVHQQTCFDMDLGALGHVNVCTEGDHVLTQSGQIISTPVDLVFDQLVPGSCYIVGVNQRERIRAVYADLGTFDGVSE
jgi:hypothetical protein